MRQAAHPFRPAPKQRLLLALALLGAPACLVDNELVGRGDAASAETQISADAGAWCESICTRIERCPNDDCVCTDDVCDCASGMACRDNCVEYLQYAFLGRGETCAQAGQRQMACLDQASCSAILAGELCALSAEDRAACSDDTGGGDEIIVTPENPPAVGSWPISCGAGHHTGPAPSGEEFRCEMLQIDCDDGRRYASVCSGGSSGPALCTCFLDDGPTRSFFFPELTCPSSADLNVACHFWLLDPYADPAGPDPTRRITCADAGSSSGPALGTAFGCFAHFADCDGRSYTVDCSADDGWPTCACSVDGQVLTTFRVVDGVCPSSGSAEDLNRINAGCGWFLVQ